jgi:hypothetical protein
MRLLTLLGDTMRPSNRHTEIRSMGQNSATCSAARTVLGALVVLTLAPSVWGAIADDVDAGLEGSPLLVYGRSSEEARAVLADLELEGFSCRLIAAADVTDEDLASSDLFVFGTPVTNPLIARFLAGTPFRLTDTSVTVGDSTFQGTDIRLVASIPNPVDQRRKCILYVAQDEEILSGIFFGYGASYVAADFLVYRKSDGLYYQDDRLAYGSLVTGHGRVDLGEVTYGSKEPRRLDEVTVGHVRLYYDTVNVSEAETIARFVDALRDVASDEFGIQMPKRIYVYIYGAAVDETRVSMYTDAWNTFWTKMTKPKEEFFSIGMAPVAFAHEVARLAFQPIVSDPAKRHPFSLYNDDWSHYFQYTVLIPSVWAKLGPECWPAPNDFHETWGRSRFERLYSGAQDTYAYLLLVIERRYGRRIIGRTLNATTHSGARRNVAIEEFMARLAEATGDTSIVRQVAEAFPSTLEWSTNKRMEPFGFFPRLEHMIDDHRFAVDSVATGSPADLAGMRPGDEIVGINGFDLDTGKARAHRSVLAAIHADGALRLTVRRGLGTVTHEMKIRRR